MQAGPAFLNPKTWGARDSDSMAWWENLGVCRGVRGVRGFGGGGGGFKGFGGLGLRV